MAKQVERRTIGVDVCKLWLDVYCIETEETCRLGNDASSIRAWISQLDAAVQIAIEATNCYHEKLAELAHQAGHRVYVVDPLRLSRYRQAVGLRAKTDRQDARLLARYLRQEGRHLRTWQPRSPEQTKLWRLLKRRATLVQTTVRLRQSLVDLDSLDSAAKELVDHCRQLIKKIDRELLQRAGALGWHAELQRSSSIPGIGPLTAIALVATFHRGKFRSADAFVAFLGLDVRVRDSGTFRGRRKLTKRGDPELRRLLYNAAMAASRDAHWQPYYRSLRGRGLSGTAAMVALSRKLVRVCYALLQNGTWFDPGPTACATT